LFFFISDVVYLQLISFFSSVGVVSINQLLLIDNWRLQKW
jgi:hypothetical protein